MMLTLDNLAHRYHCLPSYVMEHATTFDLRVAEVYNRHAKYSHDKLKAEQKGGTYAKPVPTLTQEQMLSMIERAQQHKGT